MSTLTDLPDLDAGRAAVGRLTARRPELVPLAGPVTGAFELLATCFAAGGTAYVCGNGGSAADTEHIVGELVKSMGRPRPLPGPERAALGAAAPAELADYLADHLEGGLRAVSLVSPVGLLTAVANDIGGDMIFAQQVHALGRPGDVLWALSTSGRSRNVVLAAAAARARGMAVLALTGEPGEPLGPMADVWVPVPASTAGSAQELHQPIYHSLCEALEEAFFPLG